MKQTIRMQVFETNSSDIHAVVTCSKDDFEKFKKGILVFDYDDGKDVLKPIKTNPIYPLPAGRDFLNDSVATYDELERLLKVEDRGYEVKLELSGWDWDIDEHIIKMRNERLGVLDEDDEDDWDYEDDELESFTLHSPDKPTLRDKLKNIEMTDEMIKDIEDVVIEKIVSKIPEDKLDEAISEMEEDVNDKSKRETLAKYIIKSLWGDIYGR